MGNAALLVQLLLGLVDRATEISALLKKAHSENRDVTDDELNALAAEDDKARQALQDAINKAKAGT